MNNYTEGGVVWVVLEYESLLFKAISLSTSKDMPESIIVLATL